MVLQVSTARFDRVARTLVQGVVARVERLTKDVRPSGYQVKPRGRLAHSRNELPGSEVVSKEIQGRKLRARDESEQNIPKEKAG